MCPLGKWGGSVPLPLTCTQVLDLCQMGSFARFSNFSREAVRGDWYGKPSNAQLVHNFAVKHHIVPKQHICSLGLGTPAYCMRSSAYFQSGKL